MRLSNYSFYKCSKLTEVLTVKVPNPQAVSSLRTTHMLLHTYDWLVMVHGPFKSFRLNVKRTISNINNLIQMEES